MVELRTRKLVPTHDRGPEAIFQTDTDTSLDQLLQNVVFRYGTFWNIVQHRPHHLDSIQFPLSRYHLWTRVAVSRFSTQAVKQPLEPTENGSMGSGFELNFSSTSQRSDLKMSLAGTVFLSSFEMLLSGLYPMREGLLVVFATHELLQESAVLLQVMCR